MPEVISLNDCIRNIIEYIGEDPNREGLLDTPKRVVKSYDELFSGYRINVESLFTTFDKEQYDEMILLKNIEFTSFCVAGSTFVETPKGRIPIQYLKDGEFVYCWDEDACEMTIARAFNPRITGRNKRLYRIYTEKDSILCTGNHKFLTYTRGWIKAKNLNPGDSIISLNKGAIVENGKVRAQLNWTGQTKAVAEHRFVYEKINGRISSRKNHIHHLNKQMNDNSPENLTRLSRSRHMRLHRLEDGPTGFALFTDAQRKAMRAKQIEGIKQSQTEEVRKKRSESVKRHWDSLTAEERAERNHKVLLVERTDWREDVWCMDVPGYENFIANGMVVHNCEHHMLPFVGTASIAYVPNKRIVGISKLARVLEAFSRRLAIQERICEQITDALEKHLQPRGSACILEARHFCMVCRGVQKQNSIMVTSSLKGVFKTDLAARAELFNLIRG